MYELRSFCFNFNNDDKNDEIWLEEGRDNLRAQFYLCLKGHYCTFVKMVKYLNFEKKRRKFFFIFLEQL